MTTNDLVIRCIYDALSSYLLKCKVNSKHYDALNSRYYGYIQVNRPSFTLQFTVSNDAPHGLEIVAAVYDDARTPRSCAIFESLKDLKFFHTTTDMVAFFTFKVADPHCFQNIYELINNRKFRK